MKEFLRGQWKMTAKTLLGLEGVLAEELNELGAQEIQLLNRAVSFTGDDKLLYRANFELRTALRVLVQLSFFRARDPEDLYKQVKAMPWEELMMVEDTFVVDPVVHSEIFTHSHFAGLKVKDAIVDRFRDKTGKRPDVDLDEPVFRINLHIDHNRVTISLDSSGDSLHKRGYRRHGLKAPLNEVLAAGMIKLSGWDGDSNLFDPMCGSATMLIEAAMIAENLPAQANRRDFAFMNWPMFDPNVFSDIKKHAYSLKKEFNHQIAGADLNSRHARSAEENVGLANLGINIAIKKANFLNTDAPFEEGTLLMNPPYGERMEEEDIIEFYKNIGDTLKQKYRGYNAWVISSDIQSMKYIGLKPSKKIKLINGALECSFRRYDIFKGSYKSMKAEQNKES